MRRPTRLRQHLSDKKTQVYKNRRDKPEIALVVLVPCSKKRELEIVENPYIEEYAAKHANRLLNKRCNPAAKKVKERKKIVDKVVVHGERGPAEKAHRRETSHTRRCRKQQIRGKRFHPDTRYGKRGSKEKALLKREQNKRQKVNTFTMSLN